MEYYSCRFGCLVWTMLGFEIIYDLLSSADDSIVKCYLQTTAL